MIIYLEGPDGSGKSTLLKTIRDILYEHPDLKYMNSDAKELVSTYPKDPNRLTEKELFARLKKMALSDELQIIDRCFISDCVYRVFDNYRPVTTVHKCIEFLKTYNKKVFTIYCRTEKAEEYMLKRGDDNPITIQKHKEITKVYDMVMSLVSANLKYNYFKYDFTKKRSINELLGKLNYFVAMNLD